MKRFLTLGPLAVLLSAAMLLAQVPAQAASPSPSLSPNPGASEVVNAYNSVNPDTGALAVNTTSGSSVFALAFDIKFITGDTVTPTNLAIAYSSCSSCQAIAVSIQVVIYENGAHTVAPGNAAIAINNMCNLCDTMAAAYQLVIGESGPVRLTQLGREQLLEIRQKLAALQQEQGMTGAQVQAAVDALVHQLLQVLQTQLVPVGEGDLGGSSPGDQGPTFHLVTPNPTARPYSVPTPSPSPSVPPTPSASAVTASPTP